MKKNDFLFNNIKLEDASPIDNELSIQVITFVEQYFREKMNDKDIKEIKTNKELIFKINKAILDCCKTTKLNKEIVTNRLKSVIKNTVYVKGKNGEILLEIINDIIKKTEETLER